MKRISTNVNEENTPFRNQSELNGALEAVRHGFDPESAMDLIRHYHARICAGEAINDRVLHALLDHAFGKIIAENWSADQAFGLKARRGKYERADRHSGDTAARNMLVTMLMLQLTRRGWSYLDALEEAAGWADVSSSTIRDVYQARKAEFEAISNDFQVSILEEAGYKFRQA